MSMLIIDKRVQYCLKLNAPVSITFLSASYLRWEAQAQAQAPDPVALLTPWNTGHLSR